MKKDHRYIMEFQVKEKKLNKISVRPEAPVLPVAPGGPSGPRRPVTPMGPWGPWAPADPGLPLAPVNPVAPAHTYRDKHNTDAEIYTAIHSNICRHKNYHGRNEIFSPSLF